MKVLIADDDAVTCEVLRATLEDSGYRVSVCRDGRQAIDVLGEASEPVVVLLDWMMPEMSGLEVCRFLRSGIRPINAYCILLTSKTGRADVVAGLEAGADDYITKPFDPAELHARVRAGARVVGLQAELAEKVRDLEAALAQVRQLKGLLPICCYCKRIRDDHDYWQQMEAYISEHSEAKFSHGICPQCFEEFVRPRLDRPSRRRDSRPGSAPLPDAPAASEGRPPGDPKGTPGRTPRSG